MWMSSESGRGSSRTPTTYLRCWNPTLTRKQQRLELLLQRPDPRRLPKVRRGTHHTHRRATLQHPHIARRRASPRNLDRLSRPLPERIPRPSRPLSKGRPRGTRPHRPRLGRLQLRRQLRDPTRRPGRRDRTHNSESAELRVLPESGREGVL